MTTNDTAIHSVNTTSGLTIMRGQTVAVRDCGSVRLATVVGLSLGGALVQREGFCPCVVTFDRILANDMRA